VSEFDRLKPTAGIDLPDAVLADAADSEPVEVMEDVDAVEVRALTHCSKSQKH
jgi:hypothetical protein